MKTAFDQPKGSANFDKMAPRKPSDYLYISQIFHKTFIAVDELPEEDALALLRSHQPQGRFPNQEEDDHAREIVFEQLEAFLELDLPGTKVIVGDGPARAALARDNWFPESQDPRSTAPHLPKGRRGR